MESEYFMEIEIQRDCFEFSNVIEKKKKSSGKNKILSYTFKILSFRFNYSDK